MPIDSTGEGFESRHASWGDMTVSFDTQSEADPPELFEGLPDDRCPCPHWGYVFKGRMVYEMDGVTEEILAGQAFYLPPGHLALTIDPETETLEFSPSDLLNKVIDHMQTKTNDVGS
jgi:hypothetical protein